MNARIINWMKGWVSDSGAGRWLIGGLFCLSDGLSVFHLLAGFFLSVLLAEGMAG